MLYPGRAGIKLPAHHNVYLHFRLVPELREVELKEIINGGMDGWIDQPPLLAKA